MGRLPFICSRATFALGLVPLLFLFTVASQAGETVGDGSLSQPAVGPAPSFGLGGSDMVLVKNWHFGTNGTVKNQADLNANFQYHDQFGTIGNGTNYGAVTVAPDRANAIPNQPVEGDACPPVRAFTEDSLRTYLVPLYGATKACRPSTMPAADLLWPSGNCPGEVRFSGMTLSGKRAFAM